MKRLMMLMLAAICVPNASALNASAAPRMASAGPVQRQAQQEAVDCMVALVMLTGQSDHVPKVGTCHDPVLSPLRRAAAPRLATEIVLGDPETSSVAVNVRSADGQWVSLVSYLPTDASSNQYFLQPGRLQVAAAPQPQDVLRFLNACGDAVLRFFSQQFDFPGAKTCDDVKLKSYFPPGVITRFPTQLVFGDPRDLHYAVNLKTSDGRQFTRFTAMTASGVPLPVSMAGQTSKP